MNNPSDIKPVFIKAGSRTQTLRFDPTTNQIVMDPINIADLSLKDFTRIHGFFRRVQGLRYNIMQDEAQTKLPPATNPCNEVYLNLTFKDLQEHDFFRSKGYPNAVLQKCGDCGRIISGYVLIGDGRHALQSGVVAVSKDAPVDKLDRSMYERFVKEVA